MTAAFQIAVIATQYYANSHADVIVSRWIRPFASDADVGWADPKTRIAALYVEQVKDNDVSRQTASSHGIPVFSSVAAALQLGGDCLAVDGILLIGEHGDYGFNELGQKLYPRKELFDQVISVFRASGRVVPVFFDKHLSWNPEWIYEMYWTIRDMRIPFVGGSSLPHCPLNPEFPGRAVRPTEVVAVFWHTMESYLFHSLEVVQAFLEKQGASTRGVSTVVAWKGRQVWQAVDQGLFSFALLSAAAEAGSSGGRGTLLQLRDNRSDDVFAFQLVCEGGLKITHFMHKDMIRGWSFALAHAGPGSPYAARVEAGGSQEHFPHFARLNRVVEDFFLSGVAPIPLERLFVSSLTTAACLRALATPNAAISTPEIALPAARRKPASILPGAVAAGVRAGRNPVGAKGQP